MQHNFDPILVSIVQSKLKAITEEMGMVLLRTTRSPILNEARDFVTGLYDEKRRMLEQVEYIPVLAFALQPVCQRIISYFIYDIHPGDVFLHNDVFSGGNQNNDIAVFKPIFIDGELTAWAACKGHQADIGGNVAGGYNPEAREVWQNEARAFGLFGGMDGEVNLLTLEYPDEACYRPRTKEIIHDIPTGTRYHQIAGGGGGYGDPFKRSEELVLNDVLNDFVSEDAARSLYRVVVDITTKKMNKIETAKLRGKP